MPDIRMRRQGGKAEPPRCQKCQKREGTEDFSNWPDGRYSAKWCKICVLEAQIEHAKERQKILPTLEAQLAELRAKEKE